MSSAVPGLFVTFEGGDGAGKTTQITRLHAALEHDGLSVTVTREPGGDAFAEGIRSLLLHNEMTPRAELLLFLAARAQNVESVIRPHLAEGQIVICDRYIDSSIAYQGFARGLGHDMVDRLNGFATNGLRPDVTILLDLPPEEGLLRQTDQNRMEAESLAFHNRVREGFLAEAQKDPARFVVFDALQSVEQLHAKIYTHIIETWKARQNP